MRSITAKLLKRLEAAAPERAFEVEEASTPGNDDFIRLDEKHWLSIDAGDITMVSLTDETPQGGGQLAFWFIRQDRNQNEAVLNKIIQTVHFAL